MRTLVLLIIISLFLIKVFSLNTKQDYSLSKDEQLVNSLLAKTTKIIQNKYDINPSGVGVSRPCCTIAPTA